jgi:hypothetical protein
MTPPQKNNTDDSTGGVNKPRQEGLTKSQEDFLKVQNDLYDRRVREIEQEDNADLWFAIGATTLTALLVLACAAYFFWPGNSSRGPGSNARAIKHRVGPPQIAPKPTSHATEPTKPE